MQYCNWTGSKSRLPEHLACCASNLGSRGSNARGCAHASEEARAAARDYEEKRTGDKDAAAKEAAREKAVFHATRLIQLAGLMRRSGLSRRMQPPRRAAKELAILQA